MVADSQPPMLQHALQHASRCIRLPPVHFAINACGGRSQGQDRMPNLLWLVGFEGHYPPGVADGALCPLNPSCQVNVASESSHRACPA
ncbi:hypothetical protein E4U44_008055 [Claviceps purpurea]|nr:hypothetical protein E4U44_008055 [Claviceps purpurea]